MPHTRPLRTADSKLRLLEEKLNVGTWTWDLLSSEITWSHGLFRMLGFDPSSVVPTLDLYQSLVHPDDQMTFDDAIGLASDRRLQNRKFRIIRPDGSLRWLHSKAQPHLDRSGVPVLLFGVIVDVTEEEELKATSENDAKVASILTRLLKGKVWRASPNGKLIETADWTSLTGETAAQAHDWASLSAIHPDDREKFRENWRRAISSKEEYSSKFRVLAKTGRYVQMASRAMPLVNASGAIDQWVGYSVIAETSLPEVGAACLCSAQIRAARGFLDWTAQQLAEFSGVSFSTIRRMEASHASVRADSVQQVRATFEKRGIVFVAGDDGLVSIGFKLPDSFE
ncbi:PAS domain-containing protein [Rhizobium sp. NPDC090275]|uniref:PAS domain-containing protein n=1 Tax=Rhizobium sp. NPDC090275 TaxID=3364498 RepID=UPI00383A3C5E